MNKKAPLSAREQKWTEKMLGKMGGKASIPFIVEHELTEVCKKKFGRDLTINGLYSRFAKLALKAPGVVRTPRIKRVDKVFEKSNYVVFVKHVGVSGFESEKEVEDFIKSGYVIGKVEVFKRVPVVIECKVKLG